MTSPNKCWIDTNNLNQMFDCDILCNFSLSSQILLWTLHHQSSHEIISLMLYSSLGCSGNFLAISMSSRNSSSLERELLVLSLRQVLALIKEKLALSVSLPLKPLLYRQVQNKLDGCYYAVKRIQVNPASKQFRRIKGEVTLLSRLNHENIVRYYNAWIERHETPSTGVLSNTDSSEPQSTPDKSPQFKKPPQRFNELGLPDNVEDIAPPPALSSSVEWSTSIERSSSAKCSGDHSSDEEDDEDEDEDVFGASFLYVLSF